MLLSAAEEAMSSVLSDAACANKHVNIATPLASRAVLCASIHKAGGCYEGLPSSFSLAELFQPGWQHGSCYAALKYMPFVNVQRTTANNPGATWVLSHFIKQRHGKNCFQTYVYPPPNLLSFILLYHAL